LHAPQLKLIAVTALAVGALGAPVVQASATFPPGPGAQAADLPPGPGAQAGIIAI